MAASARLRIRTRLALGTARPARRRAPDLIRMLRSFNVGAERFSDESDRLDARRDDVVTHRERTLRVEALARVEGEAPCTS